MHESILAGRLLTIMAGRVTENLVTFSSWLIGSFTAVLGLLLSNIDTVSKYLPAKGIGSSVTLFLFAVALHVIQRYLAAIVAGSVAVSKEVESLSVSASLNFPLVMDEIEKSTFWPARILVRRTLKKVRAGDFAASGRMVGKITQVQGFLVVAQMITVTAAAYVLVKGL